MRKLKIILPLILLVFSPFGCQKAEETPETSKEESSLGVVRVDGFDLAYSIEGTGIPCVIVEEGLAIKRALSQNLKKHFKFIFLNGRHVSPYDRSFDITSLTLGTFVDDVERVRKALGLEKICVFGHSIWGLVALEYGKKYPDNTTHIIMNATPPYFKEMTEYQMLIASHFESEATPERKAIHKENLDIKGPLLAEAVPGRIGIETYIANAALYWNDPKYDSAWLFEGLTWNDDIDNHLFNMIMPGYDIKNGGELQTPIFLSLGKYDFVVPYYLWDEYLDTFPNLSYNLFEQSGHWAFLEEQELFDKKLIDWIEKN